MPFCQCFFRLFFWHRMIISKGFFVSPLVRMDIMPARCILKARGSKPIFRQSNGSPRFARRQFFLTNIMTQTATIFSNTTRKHERMNCGTIHKICVIPMIDTRTNNHRAFSTGFFRCACPFSRKTNQCFRCNSCIFFCPRWCVSCIFFVIFWITFQSSSHAILSHEQIIHSGNRNLTIGCFYHFYRHISRNSFALTEIV